MSIVATPHPDSPLTLGARFDWYACTVNASVAGLQRILALEFGGEWAPRDGARHGFQHRELLELLDGSVAVTMLHGGNGDLPHVYASGDTCEQFVNIIRTHYAGLHKVSRVDAAIDYDDGPGTWETLLDFVTGIAKGERVDGDTRRRAAKVRTNQMGDWLHGEKGRTFYLGSFKSAVLVRLYEKGIQLREDAAIRGKSREDVSVNYCRLECQVRPDGISKEHAATATPFEVFGYADWSRELLRRVEAQDVQRVHIKERRESDFDRSMNWMVHQYGAHILRQVSEVGGWEFLGEALRKRMETGDTPTMEDDKPW